MNGTQKLSPQKSMFILILAVLIILLGITMIHAPVVVCLVTAGMVTTLLGMAWGIRWDDIEEDIKNTAKTMFSAILVLMFVGMMVGVWMLSGTVPYMMYYGLKLLNPSIFLVAATILCAIMSMMTGTAWGTASTLGVALIGVSAGLGIPLEYTAGAIVAGAIFGDKLSPLSDTTILAPAVSGADMLKHIRAVMYTTLPGFLIGIVLYFILGLRYSGTGVDGESYQLILSTLEQTFRLNPLLLLPPLTVLILIFCRQPAIPVFAIGIALGGILAVVMQGCNLTQIAAAINNGYTEATGVAVVDGMIKRGGINSMMSSIALIIGASVFGAPLKTTGVIGVLLDAIQRRAKSPRTLLFSSYLLHTFLFMITGAYYVTFSIVGPILGPLYDRYDLDRTNLSRMLEDSGTAFSPIVPWGNPGVFYATTLGVSTLSYAPYAPLTYCSMIFAFLYIATGFAIFKKDGTMLIKERRTKAAGPN